MKATENNLQHALQSGERTRRAQFFRLYSVIVCFHLYRHFHDSLSQLQIYTTNTHIYLCNERLSNNFHFTFELID